MTDRPRSERSVAVLGAGMVGRGLVGELFAEAGWQVWMLDVDQTLVGRLVSDRGYRHITVSGQERTEKWVPCSGAVAVSDPTAAELVAGAELVVTSVGAQRLPGLAGLLARAQRKAGDPVDVILCENLGSADQVLRRAVSEASDDATAEALGLARSVVGRMIPVADPGSSDVITERFGELPIDAAALRRPHDLPARIICDQSVPFDFYEDRKLCVHNLGHFLAALLGRTAGVKHLHEAVARPDIWGLTHAVMTESAMALLARYQACPGELLAHVYDLLDRFGNQALNDSVDRVSRDIPRKLGPGERVQRSLELAAAGSVPSRYICLTRRLAELFDTGERPGLEVVASGFRLSGDKVKEG